jgi:AbrB family looped-hinge helix DNA binding protein
MHEMKMSEGGRVVVPVEIRKALGLHDGDTVLWELRDGEARLTTRRARLEKARRLAAPWLADWTTDDFIAERRKQAAGE